MPRPARLALASLALAAPLALLSTGVAAADVLVVPVDPCEHVIVHHPVVAPIVVPIVEPVVVAPAPLLSVRVAPVVVG